jgi:hypothetical protein
LNIRQGCYVGDPGRFPRGTYLYASHTLLDSAFLAPLPILAMRRSILFFASPLGALAATPYSTWMADSVISRAEAAGSGVSYETGVIQKSFEVSLMWYNITRALLSYFRR